MRPSMMQPFFCEAVKEDQRLANWLLASASSVVQFFPMPEVPVSSLQFRAISKTGGSSAAPTRSIAKAGTTTARLKIRIRILVLRAEVYLHQSGGSTERAEKRRAPSDCSVSCMKGVVEIDAGEDRKHVGLQECHQQFKRRQRNRKRQRCDTADPADRAEGSTEQRDKAREHLQGDVAGQHVGKQADAVRKRPRKKGN